MAHAENPGKMEDTVFMELKVSKLPKDMQKRHKVRRKKIDKLHDQISDLGDEGRKDLESLADRIKKLEK